MEKIITVVLPLFAMILCGYGIVRAGIIGKETVRGLVGVVFWLFLPCFIFMKTLGANYQGGINWSLLNAYYLACLLVFLIAAAVGHLLWGGDLRIAGLRGLTSISGVVGYMGLPLMVMTFGDAAVLPAVMITTADNLVILAGGSLLMEMTSARTDHTQPGGWKLLISIAKGIIRNPLILAVLLAAIFITAGLSLPSALQIFAKQMTDATGPLALVALGAALAIHPMAGFAQADSIFLAVLKVVVLPGLVFVSCRYGFGLDPFSVKIAVLMAALPVAVNVFILASRYQSYEAQVSSAMLLSAGMGLLVISGLMLTLN